MTHYRTYFDFTAQSKTVSAFMSMYAALEREPNNIHVELTPIIVFLAS
jgi:hypothetical protein